jgi:hypothetical protein
MQTILTLEDLIHAMTNSLSVISGHSQHLLTKEAIAGKEREDLVVIREQAERAVNLLELVPRDVVKRRVGAAAAAAAAAQAAGAPADGGLNRGRRADDVRLAAQEGVRSETE